jgi:hypothetical protein
MGQEVKDLQEFLFSAGFTTKRYNAGVFDYATQAAVRLFQEYVRTIDKDGDKNMVPDGIVGEGTMKHVRRWKELGLKCDWGPTTANNPSKEYKDWFALLTQAKAYYKAKMGPILTLVNNMRNRYSTKKIDDWDFDKDKIHLIGIRRNQEVSAENRQNDDLFILLINGNVFKFWGSTDPNVKVSGRKDEAFLVEGQHHYRFGWHKITDENKIYRALKPFDPTGVLIIRDWDDDNALTTKDLEVKDNRGNKFGLVAAPDINIHWSGYGGFNFSAGCQVISGQSYINNQPESNGNLVDCSGFASRSYGDLNISKKKTKGAYNVLADLVVCYSDPGTNSLLYTLGREESLNISSSFGPNYASDALNRMKSIL